MVSTGNLLAFATAAFVLIVVPGPSVLFVVGRALTIGRSGALATVVANEAGLCVQIAAVAFGVGALVQASVAVFTTVKLVGAAYLVYLGVQAIRHRRDATGSAAEPGTDSRRPPKPYRRIVREGFVVGVTNPKSLVLFAAVLPQFIDRGAGHATAQMLLLGLVAVLIALVTDSTWALVAGAARSWFGRSPRRLAALGGTGGAAMVGLGTHMALTGRP